jgi:hypothetical protein
MKKAPMPKHRGKAVRNNPEERTASGRQAMPPEFEGQRTGNSGRSFSATPGGMA